MNEPITTLRQMQGEARQCLTENILPYWLTKMQDPAGGFYGRRDGHDVVDAAAPKGAILCGRLLWTFSAAYRVLGNDQYLAMATRAKRELIDRFYDHEYGGVYWSLDADGQPLDTKKQFYALGFAIYGLSEYARATGDAEARDYALRLFHDIESHSRDRQYGGYLEATTRQWLPIDDMRLSERDANACKTMNTHLHIIEPYTNLLRMVPDNQQVRQATADILRIFLDRIIPSGQRGHLGLFFDRQWQRQDREISYGHDIEAAWLLLETAQVLGDPGLLAEVRAVTRRVANAAYEGRCADGSMVYERLADGRYDNDKHWWVQAETVVGQLWQGDTAAACRTWQYIKDNIVDHDYGEWIWSQRFAGNTHADGAAAYAPNRTDDHAGFWKCPYHNGRMCLEILQFNPQ